MNGARIGTTTATTGARRNEIRWGQRGAPARLRGAAPGGIILRSRARRRVPAFRRSSNTRITVSESRARWMTENGAAVGMLQTENSVRKFAAWAARLQEQDLCPC